MKRLFCGAVALVMSLTFVGCKSSEHVEVAKAFSEHMAKGEFDEATKLADSKSAGLISFAATLTAAEERDSLKKTDFDFVLLSDEVRGDSAFVKFVNRAAVPSDTTDLTLTKVEGEWKVSLAPDK